MTSLNKTLALLEEHRGICISGEYIASMLNISRSAVWKVIKALRKEGYRIDAITNKGYCLLDSNDIISKEGILPFLPGVLTEDDIHTYKVLDSTQTKAKAMAMAGAKHGTLIIAEEQTHGRGRYERSFYSQPGMGIYLSIIMLPGSLAFDSPVIITQCAAVAVCMAIETLTGKPTQVKWVNDVFMDGNKICGILTECVTDIESQSIQWMAVGIGVNFCAQQSDFPEELRHIAGAVFNCDPTVTRNQLIAEIAKNMLIAPYCADVKSMYAHYKERLMMLGKRVTVSGIGVSYEAMALDVDDTGRLLVKKDNGEETWLFGGEISVK